MRYSTIKKLSIIAAALFGAAFLFTVLAIPFQSVIKRLMAAPQEAFHFMTIPWAGMIVSFLKATIAGVFLLVVCLNRSAARSRGAVIALTISLGFVSIILSGVLNVLFTAISNTYGTASMASQAIVLNGISLLVTPCAGVGNILLLLAMGAYFGRAREDKTAL